MTTETKSNKKVVKAAVFAAAVLSFAMLSWFYFSKKSYPEISGIVREENRFTITASKWKEDWKNMAVVLGHARATKIENPDGTAFFKLTDISPDGVFSALGFQNGDVVTSINSKAIYNMDDLLRMTADIKPDHMIELGIKRGDDEQVMIYKIIQ